MTASLAHHRQSQRDAMRHPRPERRDGSPSPEADAAARHPAQAPLRLVPQPEGLLQVHTAPFRGSFAAVFAQALRSAGLGSRVLVSQFLRGGVAQGVEGSLWLCGRLQWVRPDLPGCLGSALSPAAATEADATSPAMSEDRKAVLDVWHHSREHLLEGSVDLMVLDELGLAIELGYLPSGEVTAALEQRPAHLDVILTGPSIPSHLLAMADQVTELRRGL
jgi:cob(I)alamin adenosyltransferase